MKRATGGKKGPDCNIEVLRRRAANVRTTTSGWTGKKLRAYELVFYTAKAQGNLDAMREVAPFCGKIINVDDLRTCLTAAISNQDWKSVVGCKCALGEKTLSADELRTLDEVCQQSDVVRFLLGMIDHHVPSWKLTPKETLCVWSIRK